MLVARVFGRPPAYDISWPHSEWKVHAVRPRGMLPDTPASRSRSSPAACGATDTAAHAWVCQARRSQHTW
jgi:hypothetical protein